MIEAIESEQKESLENNRISVVDLITFDERGVSGHVNHRDTYRTVKRACERVRGYQRQHDFKTKDQSSSTSASLLLKAFVKLSVHSWTLETETNLIVKYLPIYSWILFTLALLFPSVWHQTHKETPEGKRLYRLHQPSLNWMAMRSQASQFVWYRRLFVIFSCYTYVNVLQRIDEADDDVVSGDGNRVDLEHRTSSTKKRD